jgi:biotin synthase
MSDELQALAFLAGANSIFYGEKLLTTGNPDVARDQALLSRLGMTSQSLPVPEPSALPEACPPPHPARVAHGEA